MGFLAPLYIAGILAVGIPILLHLIRRTPQGRQMFSSLMFLAPSPPRLTKRSRLSNLLLLLLRAAAVTLLALAFARPFFHGGENQNKEPSSGRRIMFLVDDSASMRRPDLWAAARARVEEQLKEVTPADEVGLYLFDHQVRPAFSFSQWNEADASRRVAELRAALEQVTPSWSAARLGDALAATADLSSENSSTAADQKRSRTIILVTDLKEGDRAEALQGHEWPKDVFVSEEASTPLVVKKSGNASLQWVESSPAAGMRPAESGMGAGLVDGALRVRVSNEADSAGEQFTLQWHNDKGPLADSPISVYVPPGRSQIVQVPLPADGAAADRLVLSGDDCDFDNTLYIVPPHADTLRLVYLGDEDVTDVNGQLYYLRSALFDTPLRKLDLVARRSAEPVTAADLGGARLAVVARPPADGEITLLKQYVQQGGDVLWVGRDVQTLQRVGTLLGRDLQVTEATGQYALLNRIEMADPVFAPFADARFGDFTKIHFWKHRQLKWDASTATKLTVQAAFDDGSPFLLTAALPPAAPGAESSGKPGSLYVVTSGWSPAESQWALSSKFVPMLEQWVRRKDALAAGAQYLVDDAITLPGGPGEMVAPDGKTTAIAAGGSFAGTTQPGIYHWKSAGSDISLAINLDPQDSKTKPGSLADLKQWGVLFSSPESTQIAAERQRILQTNELENRQKTWRWILLAVLGLLAAETILAGRLSRVNRKAQAAPDASLQRAAT